jgi:DNA polymerase-3 subunit beta
MLEAGKHLLPQSGVKGMNFIATTKELGTNLALAVRAVPHRPSHPILGNILIEACSNSNLVILTGFDLAFAITTRFTAEVSKSGSTTVPARLLADIVAKLSDDEVSFELTDNQLKLKCGRGKFSISALPREEYPNIPEVESQTKVDIPADVLLKAIRATQFAASTDETKQVLCGVNIKVSNNRMVVAATDGHRLSVIEIGDSSVMEMEPVTLPSRLVAELVSALARCSVEDIVEIHVQEDRVEFRAAKVTLISRLLVGTYPAYWQLIPKQFTRSVHLNRTELVSALARITVLADQRHHIVKFVFNQDSLELSAETAELGSGMEIIPIELLGDPITLAFNHKYLMDALKSMAGVKVKVEFNTELAPVIFTPLGYDGGSLTYLCMPVQLRS